MHGALIKTVVSATDFSECAARAQNYAALVARTYGAAVHVLYVPESPMWLGSHASAIMYLEEAQKEGERRLATAVEQLRAAGASPVEPRVQVGIPSETIMDVAREVGADLIVIGSHGRTGLEHLLLGSTAERVIKGAPCPVLTVRASARPKGAPTAPALRRIVVPLDFSSPSLDATEYGIQLAREFDAAITLLHVLEPVYYDLSLGLGNIEEEYRKREHWRSQLGEVARAIEAAGIEVEQEIRGGVPADSIVVGATAREADLIVMGTHGRRGLSRLRFGSVAEGVLRQAPCPVLTVKSPKFEPGHRRVVAAVEEGSLPA